MTSSELNLYGRPACHLCADMERTLRALQPELVFTLRVHDIDSDTNLIRRYESRIPVLMLDETEVCHYFLDEQRLRHLLESV